MKKVSAFLIGLVILLSSCSVAQAKTTSVRGYYKPSTGTYVSPSYRTSPNKTKLDNYSTRGNYNPYSGKVGRVNPYKW